MKLAKGVPTDIQGPRNKVSGLSLYEAFACSHCSKLSLSEHNICSHHYKKHKDIPLPRSWRACKAQRIHTHSTIVHGAQHILWEVQSHCQTPHEGQASKASLTESLMKDLEIEFDHVPTMMTDECLVTPWLTTTHWHGYVAETGHDVESLCNMVAIPKDKDQMLPHLCSAVNMYFQEALALLPITDELVLKRLNSPSPSQMYVHVCTTVWYTYVPILPVAYPTCPFKNTCWTRP